MPHLLTRNVNVPSVLDKIVKTKTKQLEQRKQQVPIETLQARVLTVDRPRNFYAAVTKQPARKVNLIAELKKASPSAGLIRESFDVQELARAYTDAGADAISALTDEAFFQGNLEYIQQIKQVTPLPVLRKDFIIDEYQIYEARAYGADAVLLITEILKPAQLMDMLILASTLKMTSLIEVHTAESLLTVRKTIGFPHERYSLLGINNRNLHDQTTDVGNTLRLLDLLDPESMEGVISESGIQTGEHVDKLAQAGVRAVLIGETLMRADDIPAKITELLGPMSTPT